MNKHPWLIISLASAFIFTPGQPEQVITDIGDGYIISDMERGNTYVMEWSGVSEIFGADRPTTFIYNDGVGSTPVVPALDLDGGVDILLPWE